MTSWMIGQAALAPLRALSETLAEKFFNSPSSWIIGRVPAAWRTSHAAAYPSYADYEIQSALGQAPWAVYTPEKWAATPVIEQQHPASLMITFTQLAHSRGQQAMMAPARDLMSVPGADCVQRQGELLDAAYLRCQLPAAGSGADVFICQSQADQPDVAAYQALVQGAKAQQPAGQPLWAGLTTLRGDPVTAMLACYESVQGIADGFWLNTNAATIATAQQFLQAI